MNLKPIKTVEQYEEYSRELERIFLAEEGTEEYDRAEILSLLIEKYDEEHYSIPDPDPIEAIKYVMEEEGMNQNDLGELVGGKSKASLILKRKRGLSMTMIRNLHKHLRIPLEVLIKEYPLAIYIPTALATILVAFF